MKFEQWKKRKHVKEILQNKLIASYYEKQITNVLSNRKVTYDRMKNLAYWVKFDVKDDYLKRFDKLLKHPRNDSSSKEIYILRYGEEEGLRRFEEKSSTCCQTKENMIKRHGTKKGLKKWQEYKDKISFSNSEDGYIKRYGEKEGKRKFTKQAERNRGNLTLERKIELFGEEVGLEEYNKMKITLKERHSLKNYIRLFGEEEGTKKYIKLCEIRSYKNSLSYYIEKYGEEEGIKKIKKVKNTSSLEAFQKRYGKEEGYEKYSKTNEKKVNSQENFVNKYGESEGLERWKNYINNRQCAFSKISKELFNALNINDAYFAENEKAIQLDVNETHILMKSYIKPDYMVGNKIIEFFGDVYHGNPKLFEDTDQCHPFNSITAKELRDNDKNRIDILKNRGFDVKIVWENDYRTNKEKIIKECLTFLKK